MGIGYFLQFGFAQHALEAAFLVAVSCGLIGPFVITRTMSFAVHGTSELAFTGAVGGLLVADNPLAGALVGAIVAVELAVIAWIRHRYMDTPLLSAAFQVIVGGVLVFIVGILIGSA